MNNLLFLLALIPMALSVCWTSAGYHAAAEAFATGLGTPQSLSVCDYGTNKSLSSKCPYSCQALIFAVLGDCYCRDPEYAPNAALADPFVKRLTVKGMFELLATPKYFPAANCREFLSEREREWKCL